MLSDPIVKRRLLTSPTAMSLKEAIPGFEPGSPDSKSGVINHYTKSPDMSGTQRINVMY